SHGCAAKNGSVAQASNVRSQRPGSSCANGRSSTGGGTVTSPSAARSSRATSSPRPARAAASGWSGAAWRRTRNLVFPDHEPAVDAHVRAGDDPRREEGGDRFADLARLRWPVAEGGRRVGGCARLLG